ncbi:MAG TPA: hypothetical protein VE075_06740 [Thermoanaerobaculia bacterium]|nr:hypothetical protein [Thermoanaerobaculia bacterium]
MGLLEPPAPKVFLLSPASATGRRALQLASPRASFAAAERLRSPEGLPIGEAFCFMSALYFRGKMAYARRFAAAPWKAAAVLSKAAAAAAPAAAPAGSAPGGNGDDGTLPGGVPEAGAILVIAPGFGLVPPEWPLDLARLRKLARTPVDPARRAYSAPLRRQARELALRLPATARIVLLGSIATGKYLDLLVPILGERLLFPRAFVGTGDMRRGALMLRAAASGEELEYAGCEQRRGGSPGLPPRRA